jgi:hypothetical protein
MASSVHASTRLQPGFFVTGGAAGVPSSDIFQAPGFAVDRQGDEHLLLSKGNRHSLVTSYTRRPGSSNWVTARTPSLHLSAADYQDNKENEDTRIATGITTNGRRQYAVVTDCKGVYVATAPAGATNLGGFHKVLSEPAGVCQYQIDDDGPYAGKPQRYHLVTAVALPDNRVAALFRLPASHSVSYEVVDGRPGRAFHAMSGVRIPPGQVEAMARDPRTGELILVSDGGTGSPSSDNNSVFVTSKRPGHQWSAPTEAATGSSSTARTHGYDVDSVAAVGGRVKIALEYFNQVGNGTVTYGGAFLVSRSTSGHWGPVRRLPITTTRDKQVLLLADPATGHFDAVFARHFKHRAANYTIEHETLAHGTWTKPTAITSGDDSAPKALGLTPTDKLVVAYTKYTNKH